MLINMKLFSEEKRHLHCQWEIHNSQIHELISLCQDSSRSGGLKINQLGVNMEDSIMSQRTELWVFAIAKGHSLSGTKKDGDISSHMFSKSSVNIDCWYSWRRYRGSILPTFCTFLFKDPPIKHSAIMSWYFGTIIEECHFDYCMNTLLLCWMCSLANIFNIVIVILFQNKG